jgi:hypothetical protein
MERPQVANGTDALQVWRAAANKLTPMQQLKRRISHAMTRYPSNAGVRTPMAAPYTSRMYPEL